MKGGVIMSNLTYTASNGLVMDLNYKPDVYVEDITKLTNEEWLQHRKTGIGGSDYGIIYGLSTFKTKRDLFFDKVGATPYWNPDEDWFRLEVGHALEELVAKLFYVKTGYQPYAVRKMFRHPKYYWMLADVDYFVDIPDSDGVIRTYILEIKTTSYLNKDAWGDDFAPKIPESYVLQGRSYACVANVSGIIYACLFDNNMESLIIRTLERDLDAEADIIEAGRKFWQGYVERGIEPPYTEVGEVVKKSAKKWIIPYAAKSTLKIKGAENVINGDVIEGTYDEVFARIDELKEEKTKYNKLIGECNGEITRLQSILEANIGEEREANIELSSRQKDAKIYFKSSVSESVHVEDIRLLKTLDKPLYEYLVSIGFIKIKHKTDMKITDKSKIGA